MSNDAVILFEPDGYVLTGPKLMGRQAAGNAFLKAAVKGRANAHITAYTPHKRSAQVFAEAVTAIDPKAEPRWISPSHLDKIAAEGALYLPGPMLGQGASMRLRAGPLAYSLIGVTHTTASHSVMDSLAGLLTDPVMPWDALICTSDAVVKTVEVVLAQHREYLSWRLGVRVPQTEIRLPIIPLGVHVSEFEFSVRDKREAREALGIGKDEVVALFVGRLSFHGKAHPHAMYVGLEEAAKRTGKKLVLVQCGWFANEPIEKSFKEGARDFCPSVRCLFTNGKEAADRRKSWAAADLFVSLSDNIQETFGLTPLEALATGLPVVVSDWDGYKETVRDTIDGFRIPTYMPPTGAGETFAKAFEAGATTYDQYSGVTCRTISVDLGLLVDRLSELIENPELRQTMGSAGKARVRAEFDWVRIYKRYQALYGELAVIRADAAKSEAMAKRLKEAPASASGRLDPYRLFGHYATATIGPATVVSLRPGASVQAYSAICKHGLYSYLPEYLPAEKAVGTLLAALEAGPLTVEQVAAALKVDAAHVFYAVSILAKFGIVAVK